MHDGMLHAVMQESLNTFPSAYLLLFAVPLEQGVTLLGQSASKFRTSRSAVDISSGRSHTPEGKDQRMEEEGWTLGMMGIGLPYSISRATNGTLMAPPAHLPRVTHVSPSADNSRAGSCSAYLAPADTPCLHHHSPLAQLEGRISA